MEDRKELYKNYFANKAVEEKITISKLRDKESRNEKLTEEENQAILNFERYCLSELNKIEKNGDFNTRFCELKIVSNLANYKEFLKEEYFFSELL